MTRAAYPRSPARTTGCIESSGNLNVRPSGSGTGDLEPAPAKGGTYNVVAQFEEVRFCGESWSASASPGYQVIAKVTVPSQPPDLSLKNKVSPSPVVSGNTLTYTITVTNTGGEIAEEVRLEDLIPESAVFSGAGPRTGPARWMTPTGTRRVGGDGGRSGGGRPPTRQSGAGPRSTVRPRARRPCNGRGARREGSGEPVRGPPAPTAPERLEVEAMAARPTRSRRRACACLERGRAGQAQLGRAGTTTGMDTDGHGRYFQGAGAASHAFDVSSCVTPQRLQDAQVELAGADSPRLVPAVKHTWGSRQAAESKNRRPRVEHEVPPVLAPRGLPLQGPGALLCSAQTAPS